MLTDVINYKPGQAIKITDDKLVSTNNNVLVSELNLKFPDDSINSIFLVKSTKEGKFPGVIFLHWLEPHAENSNKTEFLPMAVKLAEKHNVVSILPDAFWSTTPEKYKENPLIRWTTEFENDAKLIEKQLLHLLYSIDYLESLHIVDESNLFFCGHDFGAMFGTLLGAFKPQIQAYVVMALTGKFSDWFRFGNQLTKVDDFLDYVKNMEKFDPITNIELIKQDIFFQFALNDFYIPVEKALELINKKSGNKKITWYKSNHGMNEEVFQDAEQWLIKKIL